MNRRDTEQLSAYLDGELKPSDSTKLEARLKTDPELASVLNDIRATRTLLRKLPSRKAPRNFTLTRKMVGQNPPLPRTYPIFRFATAVATLLFIFSIGVNSFGAQMASSQGVSFVMGGRGGGGDSESLAADAPAMEPAVEEAIMTEEPAAVAPAESELYDTGEESSADAAPDLAEDPAVDDSARVTESQSPKTGDAEQIQIQQKTPRFVSTVWQFGLAIVALVGALLMGLMRQLSARRWK